MDNADRAILLPPYRRPPPPPSPSSSLSCSAKWQTVPHNSAQPWALVKIPSGEQGSRQTTCHQVDKEEDDVSHAAVLWHPL